MKLSRAYVARGLSWSRGGELANQFRAQNEPELRIGHNDPTNSTDPSGLQLRVVPPPGEAEVAKALEDYYNPKVRAAERASSYGILSGDGYTQAVKIIKNRLFA